MRRLAEWVAVRLAAAAVYLLFLPIDDDDDDWQGIT